MDYSCIYLRSDVQMCIRDRHTTPCAVLGRLADDGITIGCEGDVDAELAQMTEYYLTGEPSFITDLINIDEEKNVITC